MWLHLMQADAGLMRTTDLTHDGQTKPRTTTQIAAPVETLENLLVFGFGDARAIIFDFENGRRLSADDQVTSGWRMCQCVIQQIAQQLIE